MSLQFKAGATSRSVYISVGDSTSTTGGKLTGLAYNTASLTAYYTRPGAAATAITLATQTVTGAYSSGGFVEVSSANAPGLYRLDVPDAAIASGTYSVVVTLKGAANMVQVDKEIMLVAYDPQDTVRLGLTSLPNVAFSAAGGLTSMVLRSSTAQAGSTSSTLVLDSGASSTDSFYVRGVLAVIKSGTGAGQSGIITAYTGSTKVATITPNWVTTPDNTSVFELWYLPGLIAATDYATASALTSSTSSIISATSAVPGAVGATLIGDGTLTLLQGLQICVSAMAGKTSGAGTTSIVFRDVADTLNRISATVNTTTGERSATSVSVT